MARQKNVSVTRKIIDTAQDVHSKVLSNKSPTMVTPIRSLSNVKYQLKTGYFEMLGKNKHRTLTVATVKTFAQSLKMMSLAKELIDNNDMATKREAYYVSKNWGKAGFSDQAESDTIMDDVEAMFGVNREQLRFSPEEKGGDIAGRLIVIDRDAKGKKLKIDCTRFGSGAYSIPTDVENLEFASQAKFVLAIETAGMFQRLVKYDYWDRARCILVSMGGVPTRACRRFIRRLTDKLNIPVYAFVDGDPYGYFNIYRTLKVGSGNAASVRFLGVTPEDIITYKLPTHPLKEVDIKRAKDALKNDPFVKHHKPWQNAINQMLKMGVRVEQQAFAKHGLGFVVNEYLPAKLKSTSKFLP